MGDLELPVPDLPLGIKPLLYDYDNGILMVDLIPDTMYEAYILNSEGE